jgi:regulator of protease activity HflC (stomatin/prohibitin superfamily)
MSTWQIVVLAGGVLAALTLLALSVRVVQQYEKGVQFRLGRLHGVREPGLRLIIDRWSTGFAWCRCAP